MRSSVWLAARALPRCRGLVSWAPLAGPTTSSAPASRKEDWPVLIAGGGPTGLTAALLLHQYGVRSLVLERAAALTDHPQAHFINMRTMEIFRGLEGLSSDVAALAPPLEQWRRFVYCETMTGDLLGAVDHFKGQSTSYRPAWSPEPCAHLAQHRLLPLLAQRVATLAPDSTNLRMGHRLAGFEQDGEGVTSLVEGPQGEHYAVRSRYLLAADGAHSGVRAALGINLEGPGGIQHLMNVHFLSPELGRLMRGREGMLYFVFGPAGIAVVVAHNIDAGEFVAQVPYFPPLQRPEDFTPAACTELMRRITGQPDLPLEVRTIRPWTMAGRVANSYQAGRVFLVGDAAHAFPPSGAFGMNTGVCDAHNLAWKVAAVLRGIAGPELLASYTPERKPVGLANMQLSVDNFYEELRVPAAIGLDYHAANALSSALAAPALSGVSTDARTAALSALFRVGMAASAPLRRLRQPKLDEIFASGETLRLQFPKEDLGFVYHHPGAALCRSEFDATEVLEYVCPRGRDAPYEPSTLPGARFPHAALTLLQPGPLNPAGLARVPGCGSEGPGPFVSTLDLVPAAGLGVALFLSAEGGTLGAWLDAAAAAASEAGVPILPIVVAASEQSAAAAKGTVDGRAALALAADNGWEAVRGVGAQGAVLVRPDGHVGWRSGASVAGVAMLRGQLTDAISTILELASSNP